MFCTCTYMFVYIYIHVGASFLSPCPDQTLSADLVRSPWIVEDCLRMPRRFQGSPCDPRGSFGKGAKHPRAPYQLVFLSVFRFSPAQAVDRGHNIHARHVNRSSRQLPCFPCSSLWGSGQSTHACHIHRSSYRCPALPMLKSSR